MSSKVGEGLTNRWRIWSQGGVVAAMNEARCGITRAETPKYINVSINLNNKKYGNNQGKLI
jgi:hypothetical protein